jgi:RNA polymerase sigma-70 factor (ECF subfamily)
MRLSRPGFEDLFEREYPRLVRALSRADDDATDAVQEAFVQAYVRWNRVGRLEDPAGWVRRVAIHRLLNARRSRGRRDVASAALAARVGDGVARTMSSAAERLDLRAAVRQLAAQQRIAVALFYGSDLSLREVADAMKLSEGAVKYHLHAARQRLHEMLSESHYG